MSKYIFLLLILLNLNERYNFAHKSNKKLLLNPENKSLDSPKKISISEKKIENCNKEI